MVVGLYALSLFGLEHSRVLRASYLPIRFVDDLLDGDAHGVPDPLAYAQELSQRIEHDNLTNSRIDRQLRYALEVLEPRALPTDNPRGDFIKAIQAIIFDYERASVKRLLSAKEIEQYFRDSFDPVINITLLAISSKLRSHNLPVLSYGQGRVYSARDFETDWKRGIINVPEDIISSAGFFPDSPLIRTWFSQNLAKTKPDLIADQSVIRQSGERQTQIVCNALISPLLKFIEVY
ncbi:MAG: hypothetical protein G01um101416_429 [Microgenomates group bacterium Gr01-1014_16]|nr:MAG: hypothetical protein G01um101416_429 [Microgenomates group bacterium Gr01-1014_16]